MVAFSFPSFMYWKASGVASKPMVTLFLMPAADIASTAPMIISSLAPKTASNLGYFWIRLSITFWPSERPKLAVWLTSSFTFDFLITSSKPALRSVAAEAPGVPSSSITLPLLPSLSMMNFAAARPPWTLSAPTWTSTASVFALRSTVATGMPAFTAASMAGTSESTVMGEIRMAWTPWATTFSPSARGRRRLLGTRPGVLEEHQRVGVAGVGELHARLGGIRRDEHLVLRHLPEADHRGRLDVERAQLALALDGDRAVGAVVTDEGGPAGQDGELLGREPLRLVDD